VFKLIISLLSNFVAIFVTEYLVSNFHVTHDYIGFAVVVLLFTLANSIVLPVLRTILKPLIWLTAGLLGVALNGILLYAVDKFSNGLTINGLSALIAATLIIGVVNATISYGAKIFTLGHD
jgi:uncharacterized membrane protein YvlD (DUF360 family)